MYNLVATNRFKKDLKLAIKRNLDFATTLSKFYVWPHRQMSYFCGTGQELPKKGNYYVSNQPHHARWQRTYR